VTGTDQVEHLEASSFGIWMSRKSRSGRSSATAFTASKPFFSPDGKWIAFTASYDGAQAVYVMPAEGGEPKRLTHNPGSAQVLGSYAETAAKVTHTPVPKQPRGDQGDHHRPQDGQFSIKTKGRLIDIRVGAIATV
jgi:hypothetical protein